MFKLSEIYGKKIAIVDLLTEQNKLFGDITFKTIKKYIKNNKKILFVVNKKGYTSSSICNDCGHIPKCKNCDIPIAKYVNNEQFISMCPICRRIYENEGQCQKCVSYNIQNYGIGTYKMKEIVNETFGVDAMVIENTDVNSLSKIKKTTTNIENKKYIISTSILSCETNSFKPDIVIFPNADTGLNLPDFNVNEKHFLYLYEFIKKYSTSNFLIQTFNINHHVYQYLQKLDLDGFWKKELEFRKQFGYPPYKEIAVIMYKTEVEDRLYRKISKLESELKYLIETGNYKIDIFPTPQLIYKKFGKYHYNIVLKGENIKSFIDRAYEALKLQNKGFQIDYLPTNII